MFFEELKHLGDDSGSWVVFLDVDGFPISGDQRRICGTSNKKQIESHVRRARDIPPHPTPYKFRSSVYDASLPDGVPPLGSIKYLTYVPSYKVRMKLIDVRGDMQFVDSRGFIHYVHSSYVHEFIDGVASGRIAKLSSGAYEFNVTLSKRGNVVFFDLI